MSDEKPQSYKEQNGCHNCAHTFEKYDYDWPTTLYCTYDAPPRPCCGSTAMKESFSDHIDDVDDDGEYERQYEQIMGKWDKWKCGREVRREGICAEWELSRGIDQQR